MLRLVTLAAAMVVSSATLELRPVHAAPIAPTIDVRGGVPRTARAVRTAATKYQLDGDVWLGKLRGVGGRRDTLLYIPRTLDRERPIDLVVYMEGMGSFEDAAMDHRHAASMARLRGNFVYVAPDAPSSSHGRRDAGEQHWQAGCAERACPGGHGAPGDFVVFLNEVRAKIARTLDARSPTTGAAPALDLHVSLIGFSRGGKGILSALEQLAAVKFEIAGRRVQIADVVFADGNYLDEALEGSWQVLVNIPDGHLTILVGTGEFSEFEGPGNNNRHRALLFWRVFAPDASEPDPDRPTVAPRMRIVPLAAHHHAIGDAAVDFLAIVESNRRAT